jgi:hypothetical protein
MLGLLIFLKEANMVLEKLATDMAEHHIRGEDLAAKTGLSLRTILNAREGKSVSVGTASLINLTIKQMMRAKQ